MGAENSANQRPQIKYLERRTAFSGCSFVVTLFPDRQSDGQPVLRRRQGARGKRRISTRRVFQAVQIEPKLARLVDALARQNGVKKPASLVSRCGTRGVAENKKKLRRSGIFENRLQPVGFALQNKFRSPRNRLRIRRSRQRRQRDRLRRMVRNPIR